MAQITLRKASALQKSLQDLMASIDVKCTLALSEFQDPAEAIATANSRLLANDSRRNDLLMSIYSLRSLVGQGNAQSGIADKLSHAAYVDKRIAQLEAMAVADNLITEITIVSGKLDKIRNRPADARGHLYGYSDEISTGVLSSEQIDGIRSVIRDLKKQKQRLNDEILELNIRTEIQLTPDVEAVLVREALL
jgi:hypothetical protein